MSDSSTETHRAFSIRVPMSLYLKISTMAQAEGVNLNAKMNQLIKLGLSGKIDLDEQLRQLLTRASEQLETPENDG